MSNEQTSEQTETVDQEQTPRSKIKTRAEIESGGATAQRRPTPTSILVYVAVVIGMFAFWGAFPGYPPLELESQLATSVFVRLLVVFLLINRSVIGWIIGIVLEAIYIIVFSFQISSQGPAEAAKLWGLLFISIAAMALLLTRATRQHIWAPDPEIVAQKSQNPEETDETESKNQAESPSSSGSSSSTTA